MKVAQIGDLVKCGLTGMLGIVAKSRHPVIRPLTMLYVKWVNQPAAWITAMNLRRIQ
jgi:hypothetical protein